MSNDRFKHESLQDAQSIVKYLDALGIGFSNGAIRFRSDEREFVLNPQGLVNLSLEAKRRQDEIKLNLKLKWTERTDAETANGEVLSIEPVDG